MTRTSQCNHLRQITVNVAPFQLCILTHHHLTATYFSLLVSRQNISGMDECKLPSATRNGVLFNGVDHSAWSVAECSCPTGNLVHTSYTNNTFWYEKHKAYNPYKTPWFKDDPEGYYCLPWCCTGLQIEHYRCQGPGGFDSYPCGGLSLDAIRTTLRGPDNMEGCTSGKSKRRCIPDCGCTVCTPGQYVKTDIDQEDVSKDRTCTHCGNNTFSATANANSCTPQPYCSAGQRANYTSLPIPRNTQMSCTACKDGAYMNKTSHREPQCVQQTYCGTGEKFVASLTSERTCEPCADGFYQDTPNHFEPQCKAQPKCNKGQRAATPVSNTVEQDCVPCGEHTFQNGTDHRIAQCYDQPSCSAGFFISADSVEAKRICTPCQANRYQAQSAHRIEQCALQERCTLGEFYTRNPTVARACEVCAEGTYQDLPDHVADTCMEQPGCPPAGTFYAPDRNATRTCQPCPPNTHQNVSEHRIQSCGDDPTCPDSPNGIGYEYNGTAAVYGSCVAATCNGDPDPAACRDGTDVIDCSDTFLADDCKALCGTCTAPTTSTTTAATTITNTTTTLTDIAEEPSSGTTTSSTVVALASALSVCALVAAVAVTMHCRNARSTAGQGGEGRRMDAAPRQRGQTTQNRLFLHHGHAGAQNGPLQQPYSDGLSGNSDDYATIDDC